MSQNGATSERGRAEGEEQHADDIKENISLSTVQVWIDAKRILQLVVFSSSIADTAFPQTLQKVHAFIFHERSPKARQTAMNPYSKK